MSSTTTPSRSQNKSNPFQTPPRPRAIPKTPLSSIRRSAKQEPRKRLLDAPKRVYLIRHGQSLGQASSPASRLNDASLQDCKLSPLGIEQARNIPELLGAKVYQSIQLVLCSPLARALETAILAFPDKQIRIHHDLREIGNSKIPENIPLSDSVQSFTNKHDNLSQASPTPKGWPCRHDASPRVLRRDQVRRLLQYGLATDESVAGPDVTCLAVVCHYHVIRAALSDPYSSVSSTMIQPQNAVPIKCILDVYGVLQLADDEEEAERQRQPNASSKDS
jgi:broad specificity phosphatase PhoE